MIDLGVLKGSSFVVLGLARSGLATVRALKAAGIDCVAWDDNADLARGRGRDRRSTVVEPASIDWSRATALIISPASRSRLPKPHPVAAAARANGKKIICDVELLARAQPQARFRRHHRHQRQVDHDGADRPYPGRGRRGAARSAAISAAARSISRRSARAASMCWSSRPTSSNCSTPSAPMSRSGSTSRPTISTAMATWRAMSRPRRTFSPASSRATAP